MMNTHSSGTASSSKSVSTTSNRLINASLANGFLDPVRSSDPSDKEEIIQEITMPRQPSSPVPDVKEFERWTSALGKARNQEEIKMTFKDLMIDWRHRKIENDGKTPSYLAQWEVNLSYLLPSLKYNTKLSAPKIDYLEGFEMEAFHPFRVENVNAAVCTTDPYAIALPFFLIEFKGPRGLSSVARAQAAYDAACIIYGHNEMKKYQGKEIGDDKKVHIFSMTTDGDALTIYGHFSVMAEDGSVTYHQKPLVHASPTTGYESFKVARAVVRNVQDLARQRSEDLRDMLKHESGLAPIPSLNALPPPQKRIRSDSFESIRAKRTRHN